MPVTALLRHGEVIGGTRFRGRHDDPLTVRGWKQMEQPLKNRSWDRVVTSPRHRCAAFAHRWASRRGIPVSVDERLRELDFGDWEGLTPAEVHAHDPERLGRFWQDPWRHPPPTGESLTCLEQRVLAAWRDWQAEPGAVLFITHGGVIRLLLWRRLGWARERIVEIQVGHGELVPLV